MAELERSASLVVKYHIPDNLTFQHIHIKKKVKNPYKNIKLEEINCSQNGIIIDTLNFVDVI